MESISGVSADVRQSLNNALGVPSTLGHSEAEASGQNESKQC